MANIQVTHDSNPNNARSESNIAINPNNPLQVVSSSKKFANIETYNFTLATEYSTDGGQTWQDSATLALPGSTTIMTDPTLAWDDSGNVFLVGLAGTLSQDPPPAYQQGSGIIAMYKSTDGGKTWSAPYPISGTGGADKQWAAGDSNPASPFHGNVYAVWDKLDAPGGTAFAKTDDHGATWVGAGGAPAGSLIGTGTAYPEIDVSADGFIYIVAMAGDQVQMLVSTDGGDTFTPSGTPPASGVTNPQGLPACRRRGNLHLRSERQLSRPHRSHSMLTRPRGFRCLGRPARVLHESITLIQSTPGPRGLPALPASRSLLNRFPRIFNTSIPRSFSIPVASSGARSTNSGRSLRHI